jgi:hypothetical protein
VTKSLYYNPDEYIPNTKEIGILRIDDTKFDIEKYIHTNTLKSKGKEGCRPRIYPDAVFVKDLNPVIVDETTAGEVVQIQFNEHVENYVFFASRDSKCPLLREIYEIYYENRTRLMQIIETIQQKLAWTVDTLGGGDYIPCGIAMRGGTKDSRADLPFLMKSGRYAIIMELVDIYAKILGKQAKVIQKYCPNVYDENERIYMDGEKHRCNFPTRKSQLGNTQEDDDNVYWRLHQFAIRIMGGMHEHSKQKENDKRIAWHVDDQDVQSKQPLTFLPFGPDADNGGGHVQDSDLMVFEHNKGGKCYRLRTSIADTVVFVLMNSGLQLHGTAKDLNRKIGKHDNMSMRLIPYGRPNVSQFVQKMMENMIKGEVYLDVKLKKHSPLNRKMIKVGDRVMMKYGKTKKEYLATIALHDGKMAFLYDDGTITICGTLAIYSADCYKHIPSECSHCNPR